MPLTDEQIESAREFHFAVGTMKCERWRRNGVTKRWKRSPERFQIPIKFGLYRYFYITNLIADDFHTAEDCPHKEG